METNTEFFTQEKNSNAQRDNWYTKTHVKKNLQLITGLNMSAM